MGGDSDGVWGTTTAERRDERRSDVPASAFADLL